MTLEATGRAQTRIGAWAALRATARWARSSRLAVAALTLFVSTLWTASFFASGHDARDLTFIGLRLLPWLLVTSFFYWNTRVRWI